MTPPPSMATSSSPAAAARGMPRPALVVLGVIVFVGLLAVPVWFPGKYLIHLWVTFYLFGAVATAWDLIGGYAGQLSLGHAAFFAIGAYTSVLFLRLAGLTPLIGGVLGAVLAAAVALGIGYIVFRLRGVFFAMATIAFAQIVYALLLHFQTFTQGDNGLAIPFTGDHPMQLMFRSEVPFYYIALGLLALTLWATSAMRRSRIGYYLRAIRDDQDAAESVGVPARRAKLWALALSAGLTALGGTVYAFDIGFINPDSTASLGFSIEITIMAIVGGVGSLAGPVLGAGVIIALTQVTNAVLGARGGASTALYGLLLIITVLIQPAGLVALRPGKR